MKLEAKLNQISQDILNDRDKLFELTRAFGGPLNLIFPEEIRNNLNSFSQVYKKHSLIGRVNFAHKASASISPLRELSLTDGCIDVASVNELKNALASGFNSDRIEATGPKSIEFITLCLQQGCLINIDSFSELQSIIDIGKKLEKNKIDILLRINTNLLTNRQYLSKDSRFGLNDDELEKSISLIRNNSIINLRGLSFHLDSISINEKALAIESCMDLYFSDLLSEFSLDIINIGGGFRTNYLKNREDWENFMSRVKTAAISQEKITWNNSGYYGFHHEKNTLKGSFNTYEYYSDISGPNYLDELLNHKSEKYNCRIADLISDNALELWIEPGRAMLDGLGLTIAEVDFVKQSANNDTLVGLNLKRTDISFMDQEFLVDPIIINKNNLLEEINHVYFVGNLCLESDFIFRRKIELKQKISVGDLVIFPNTAGYFMDFSATESIQYLRAEKIAIRKESEKLIWFKDKKYQPLV